MQPYTQELVDVLRVTQLEAAEGRWLYEGTCEDLGFRNLFGGQILGQSLYAACRSIAQHFRPHALHAYFLLPGTVTAPVLYQVQQLRQGKSFATLRVDAYQNGQMIFTQTTSFQVPEEGMQHQRPIPAAPAPEGLTDQLELTRKFAHLFADRNREKYTAMRALETRQVNPLNIFAPDKREPHKYVWYRTREAWPADDWALPYALLAYSSDFNLVTTALLPHGVSFYTPGIQLASLDHALWFHREPKLDNWLLYEIESPIANGGRGLNHGFIYHKGGELLVSVAQEGLMRVRPQLEQK